MGIPIGFFIDEEGKEEAIQILLNQKKKIIDRSSVLAIDKKVQSLRSFLGGLSDLTVRREFEEQLDELQEQTRRHGHAAEQIEEAKQARELKWAAVRQEISERRSKTWKIHLTKNG